ncbi:hypothetical protein EA58_20795 [Photobacterium galatheae]|uniref:Uncharacterized protein n=1 Tax=Photobacterium galatheae TaxID=1654360 RepID=A0A066RL86_9GAMM|nr:hypothetical protein EA58_20795 [Photobacterium galatheae]
MFTEKLESNGPRVICDQPVYQKCYQISEANCVSELTPISQKCASYAQKKWPISSLNDAEKHATYYFNCMIFNHFTVHQKDWHEAYYCLEENKDSFDPNRYLPVLFE